MATLVIIFGVRKARAARMAHGMAADSNDRGVGLGGYGILNPKAHMFWQRRGDSMKGRRDDQTATEDPQRMMAISNATRQFSNIVSTDLGTYALG